MLQMVQPIATADAGTRPGVASAASAGPCLGGVRILDLSRALAAPFCAMMLADLGADVIKVEHPVGGDQSRHWGGRLDGKERTYFLSTNRNKRSVAVDFAKPEGADIVRSLARRSDVVIENFMLGSLRKYGLDYETLARDNPRLIYCSVSGYGRTGPMAGRPGYDGVIQAECGIMSVTGDRDGTPTKVGSPIADVTAGMYAAQGILAALFARERTGRGQLVDISMLDCAVASLASVATNALLLNKVPGRFGNGHADVVPQELFATSDGHVMIHVGTDEQFERLCSVAFEQSALATDPRYVTNDMRRANRESLNAAIAQIVRARDTTEWVERFALAGISAGVVRDVLAAVTSPELAARGLIGQVTHPTVGPIRLVNSPVKMSESPRAPMHPPPLLGEHTDAVLQRELGLDRERIETLRERGIVS